jgi:hypothetical protein
VSHRRHPDPAPHARRLTGWSRLLSVVVALAALSTGATLALPAAAVEPFNVQDRITDQVGALGTGAPDAQAAVERLSTDTSYDLFVVFVDDFSGLDGTTWAQQTAQASGLGAEDVLLAVAVDARTYGMWVTSEGDITQSEAESVRTDLVEPALSADDWSGAVVAAADGLRDAALGSGSGGGGLGALLVVGLLVVLAVLVGRAVLRRRRAAAGQPGQAGQGVAGAPQGLDALATPELNRRASQALVAIDDALTTSSQELGFAQAQFGLEATRRFSAALDEAKARVQEAFRWRQQLDDSTPETEPQARQIMIAIIETCRVAAQTLDEHAEEFETLRDLQARAPQVLDDAEQRATEVAARVEPARAAVTRLATTYPPAALASVSPNPDQAAALLAGAHESVGRGREALGGDDDRATAVAAARAAQDAVAQAVTLLDAVDRAGDELARAGTDLTAAIASISSDFQDAQRLAPDDAGVQAATAAGRQAAAGADSARTGGDPLAALRDVRAAEARLDEALAPFRERAEHAARAGAQLHDLLGRLTSQVRAVADFIETRRGAVGPEARTRLSEAARLTQQAQAESVTDAVGALATAHRASELAQQAQLLAQRDVDEWEEQRRQRQGYGGGFGGGGGSNVGGMVLGGILLDSLLRGGGGHGGGGGGFGGGGFGGGGFGGGGDGGGFGGGGRF